MAEQFANLVYETSNTSGMGWLLLRGVIPGYQTFFSVFGEGDAQTNNFHYCVIDGGLFEVGIGHIHVASPGTYYLVRDTVEESSDAGTKVDFTSATKNVYHAPSAAQFTALFAHLRNVTTNPHSVTAAQAGAAPASHNNTNHSETYLTTATLPAANYSTQGIVKAAVWAEVSDGVSTDTFVNPYQLKMQHTSKTTNPHEVTYTQAGAAPASHNNTNHSETYLTTATLPAAGADTYGVVKTATSNDVSVGSDRYKAISPYSLVGGHTMLPNPHNTTHTDVGAAPASHNNTNHSETYLTTATLPVANTVVAGIVEIANITEVGVGTDQARVITAYSLKNAHTDLVNPHSVTAAQAGAAPASHNNTNHSETYLTTATLPVANYSTQGIVKAAVWAEVSDGVSTNTFVNPYQLKTQHTSKTTNPHEVTYTQVGAAPASHNNSNHSETYLTTGTLPAATLTAKGVVELATSAEVTAGTDATRVITPDALAASDFGKRVLAITCFESDVPVAVSNGTVGIPIALPGYNIIGVNATVYSTGVTGVTTINIRRKRGGASANVLSTPITIGTWYTKNNGVINTANDDLSVGDMLYVDVSTIHSATPPQGLTVSIVIQRS